MGSVGGTSQFPRYTKNDKLAVDIKSHEVAAETQGRSEGMKKELNRLSPAQGRRCGWEGLHEFANG